MGNNDFDIEKIILGLFILSPEARAWITGLKAEWFGDLKNQKIFEAIDKLYKEGADFDLPILADKFEDKVKSSYISSLTDGLPKSQVEHLPDYIRRIKERYRDRKIKEWAYRVAKGELTYEDSHSAVERLDKELGINEISKTPENFLTTIEDFMKEKIPIEWLVEGLIPRKAITLLHGKGGIGKTQLIFQLLKSLKGKEDFLGLKTEDVPVVYISYENSPAILQKKFKELGLTKDIFLWLNPPPINSKEFKEKAEKLPQGAFLIIDSLSSAHYKLDIKEASDFTPVLKWAIEERNKGFTIFFIHHVTKGSETNPIGTVSLINLVDQTLSLHTTRRKGQDYEEIDLWDYDEPEVYFYFGTGIKTRYDAFHLYIKRTAEKLWVLAPDPAEEELRELHQIMTELKEGKGEPAIKKEIIEKGKELGIPFHKIIRLLRRGEGKHWACYRVKGKKNALAYDPFKFFNFSPIYMPEKLKNLQNSIGEPDLTFQEEIKENHQQTLDNIKSCNFSEGSRKTEKLPEDSLVKEFKNSPIHMPEFLNCLPNPLSKPNLNFCWLRLITSKGFIKKLRDYSIMEHHKFLGVKGEYLRKEITTEEFIEFLRPLVEKYGG